MKKFCLNYEKNTTSLVSKHSKVFGLFLMAFLFGNTKRLQLLFAFLLLVMGQNNGFGATITSNTGTGNWLTPATWVGGVVPSAGDDVIIVNGSVITLAAGSASCASITFNGASASLIVNTGNTLTVTGAITLNSCNIAAGFNTAAAISGAGTLSCGSVQIGTDYNITTVKTNTTSMTSNITNFNILGNFTVSSFIGSTATRIINSTLNVQSGTVDIKGILITTNENASNTSTISMVTGAQSGTLLLENATPFNLAATGINATTLNGTTATVNYGGGAQGVFGTPYTNLSLSGSGIKTFPSSNVTIGVNLSIAGTASALLPNGTTATAITLTLGGTNEPNGTWGSTSSSAPVANQSNTYFVSPNTGIVNVNASCTTNVWLGTTNAWNLGSNWCSGSAPIATTNVVIPTGVPNMPIITSITAVCNNLTINNGATLTLANTTTSLLNISGDFANNGTFAANTSGITSFVGTNQSVGGVTFGNLTISSSGTKTLSTDTTVSNVLSVQAGTILSLGSFALTSTSVELECGAATGSKILGTGLLTFGGVTVTDAPGAGTNGAIISCPLKNSGSAIFTVANDGSTAVDLTISGAIGGITGNTITKAGPGTLLSSANNTYTGPTTIAAGVFQLGGSSIFSGTAAAVITMGGGTLSTGKTTGFSENAGPLNLAADSTIALGTGNHALSFLASNGVSWTSGKTLTITGWTGNFDGTTGTTGKIKVGLDATGLTTTQLAQIRFYNASTLTYYPAIILSTGEVVPLATITTNAIAGSPFCAGTSGIVVGFVYNLASSFPVVTTTFTAQLSNSSGSFASPTNLQAVTSTASGTQSISVTIPVATPAGSGYRIRVVSNSPAVNGTDNGVDLIVNSLPTTPTAGTVTQPNCVTATGSVILNSLPTSGTWTLYQNGSPIYTITGGTGTFTISGLAAGTYAFTVNNGTCTSLPLSVVITASVTKTWNNIAFGPPPDWSPTGAPTINDTVIINGDYDTFNFGNINACNLTVNSPYTLTIISGGNVIVQNNLTIPTGATLNVNDSGSLVMVNDTGTVTNTGTTTVTRTTPVYKRNDYIYWSSPVASTTIASAFAGWRLDYAFDYGTNWNYNIGTMGVSKGYIVMVPNPAGTTGTSTVTFTGAVNNGAKPITGVVVNRDYLVGNPYPSALYADQFIVTNAAVIDGTLSFWTHNTAIQLASNITNGTAGSGVYAFTSDDYAYYNLTGGVGTGYGTLANSTGTAPYPAPKPTGKIGTGQGFFVKTLASISGSTIVFNNAMRLDQTGTVLDNSQFFKTRAPEVQKTTAIEKNRVWLNLLNDQGAFKQTLVGYISGATNAIDNLYDGETLDGNSYVDFYSINQDKNLVIQGRALPFDEKDEVPLGYKTTIEGRFGITIDEVDGFFTNQSVFLEDKLNGAVVDLKKSSYSFTTAIGTFNDRFVLKYVDKTLGTADLNQQTNQVLVSVKNKQIKIDSAIEIITKVVIYDVSGKQLYQKEYVNSNELAVANFTPANQVLIVKTTLKNGKTVTEKVVF